MPWPWRRRHRDQQPRPGDGGARPLRGPERAYFQRLSGDYPKVSSSGRLMLTATHVTFTSAIGASVSVPLADVAQARDQKIRRFHAGGHDSQLVIATRSGELGFLLTDPAGWAAAIGGQLPPGGGPAAGRAGA
jgi:hypothetical protein